MTLTPEMVEIERAAFEADWIRRWPLWDKRAFVRSKRWLDSYDICAIQDCWETWLARAQSQRAVSVADLEALAASFDERCSRALRRHPTVLYAASFGHAAEELRAIIDRAGGDS